MNLKRMKNENITIRPDMDEWKIGKWGYDWDFFLNHPYTRAGKELKKRMDKLGVIVSSYKRYSVSLPGFPTQDCLRCAADYLDEESKRMRSKARVLREEAKRLKTSRLWIWTGPWDNKSKGFEYVDSWDRTLGGVRLYPFFRIELHHNEATKEKFYRLMWTEAERKTQFSTHQTWKEATEAAEQILR
jgi:hypothetical protein